MLNRILARLAVFTALAPLSFASIRLYVDASASAGGNGYTWGTAMNHLQDALAYAASHSGTGAVSEIWVAQGTYMPATILDPNATFAMVGGASMYGGFAGGETQLDQRDPVAHLTILTGDFLGDDGPNFTNRGDNARNVISATSLAIQNSTVLDGFRVVGGNGISGSAGSGGGMHIQGAAPDVHDCTFQDNFAAAGGGVWASVGVMPNVPRFTNCRFIGNVAYAGGSGGLQIDNMTTMHVLVKDCLFESNSTNGAGGGLGTSYADVVHCTIRGNSAQQGGGLVLTVEGLALDCLIVGNSCSSNGGGVWNQGDSYSGAPLGDRVSFVNCLFEGNVAYRGGALCVEQGHGTGPTILDCTFAGNSGISEGAGLYIESSIGAPFNTLPIVRNSILWNNTDPSGSGQDAQILIYGQVFPTIENCDVQGWTGALGGAANFALDPLFVDPDGCDNVPNTADDDFRLGTASPCREAGDNYSLPTDVLDQDGDGNTNEVLPLDLDGQPRLSGVLVDLGPYESNGVYPVLFCFGDGLGTTTPCPCGNSGAACHGCANSVNGSGATLASSGASRPDPLTGLESLQLHAAGMPATATAVYLQGTLDTGAGTLFGDGVRCTGGTLRRLIVKASSGGASQFPAAGDLSISQRSALLGDSVLGSGAVRYYQTYYRDPNPSFCAAPPGNTWNVTNGIAVQW